MSTPPILYITPWLITVSCCEIGERIVALLLGHEALKHLDVVVERGHSEALDDDVRQMVGEHHQALPPILEQILVVLLLILADMPYYT